jgi:hypothetical protein
VTLGRKDGYRVEGTGDVRPRDLIAMSVGEAAPEGEAVPPVQQ